METLLGLETNAAVELYLRCLGSTSQKIPWLRVSCHTLNPPN